MAEFEFNFWEREFFNGKINGANYYLRSCNCKIVITVGLRGFNYISSFIFIIINRKLCFLEFQTSMKN